MADGVTARARKQLFVLGSERHTQARWLYCPENRSRSYSNANICLFFWQASWWSGLLALFIKPLWKRAVSDNIIGRNLAWLWDPTTNSEGDWRWLKWPEPDLYCFLWPLLRTCTLHTPPLQFPFIKSLTKIPWTITLLSNRPCPLNLLFNIISLNRGLQGQGRLEQHDFLGNRLRDWINKTLRNYTVVAISLSIPLWGILLRPFRVKCCSSYSYCTAPVS